MGDVELGVIETQIPARLDRLPWSRFHWRIVIGLGTAWVLDGLEVTVVGSVASRLTQHGSGISINSAGIGVAAALYVTGACLGALFFGYLTDRFGRKKLFLVTLGLYLVATAVTAVSFSAWFFFIFRFLTGAGIGGEYAAINSAIDELIPARARGRIDLAINGSYWIGSICGSGLALLFLNQSYFPTDIGWRLTFVFGIILAAAVMLVRRHVPESPRWLFIHGREQEAEALVDQIEREVMAETGAELEPVHRTLRVRQRRAIGFGLIVRTAVKEYPTRSILCLALFIGQAFIYNGITFDLGTLMTKFFHVPSGFTPTFLILYAAANFLGPLLLGRLFDTVGRIPMITSTYLVSGVFGLLLAGLFAETGVLNEWTFIAVVMATFFLASAGASAAYLTSSEIFPMETRALAIAFFYAIGTALGGITGPLLFGPLIATGSRDLVAIAFLVGSVLMMGGAAAELAFGVKAEGAQLEDIAKPITAEEAEQVAPALAATGAGAAAGAGSPNGSGAARLRIYEQQALEHRARAAEERALAAEHRARLHELLAGETEGATADGAVQVEDTLATVSDERALAEEELAAAAEARAALAQLNGSTSGTDGRSLAAEAAMHRVRAAELRARSHEEEAQALLAADDVEAQHHREMAAAAIERARGAEQLALAAEARAALRDDAERGPHGGREGDGGQRAGDQDLDAARAALRAQMHEAWAQMHEERARAHELRATGRVQAALEHERAADKAAARARALGFRLEAAEQHAAAMADLELEKAKAAEGEGEQQRARWEEALRSQAALDDQRIRARLRRQRERDAAGIRRYRPGPGHLGRLPGVAMAPPQSQEALDREILAIERALHNHGPMDRRELARLVGSEYWGPGVFSDALRQAVADGAVRRLSRRVYAPAIEEEGPGEAGEAAQASDAERGGGEGRERSA